MIRETLRTETNKQNHSTVKRQQKRSSTTVNCLGWLFTLRLRAIQAKRQTPRQPQVSISLKYSEKPEYGATSPGSEEKTRRQILEFHSWRCRVKLQHSKLNKHLHRFNKKQEFSLVYSDNVCMSLMERWQWDRSEDTTTTTTTTTATTAAV